MRLFAALSQETAFASINTAKAFLAKHNVDFEEHDDIDDLHLAWTRASKRQRVANHVAQAGEGAINNALTVNEFVKKISDLDA